MKLSRKLFKGRYLNARFERKMACCVPQGQLRKIKILLGDARFSPILTKIELDGFGTRMNVWIHYLMGIGPNTKKIPQNSGKQIRIPEGM